MAFDGPALVVGDLIDIDGAAYIECHFGSKTAVEIATVGTITADNYNIIVPSGSIGVNNSGNIRGRLCSLLSNVSECTNCIIGSGGMYFTGEIYRSDEYVF